MDHPVPIPHVSAMDISARGRIASASGWHRAKARVDGLPGAPEPVVGPTSAWTDVLTRLGGTTALANRSLCELQPIVTAANRVIDALNGLPVDARFEDLERALGLREPRVYETHETHDRIGDAMSRVMQTLERRRAENASGDRR